MPDFEFQFLTILRALVEVAGFFLLGQGALYILAGHTREKNGVYQLFRLLTRPVIFAGRFLVPKRIAARHIPLITFSMLFVIWILLAYLRQRIA